MRSIALNISVLAAILGGFLWGTTPILAQSAQQRLEEILRSSEFNGASVGMLAISPARDTIFKFDIQRELIPASNLKLVTTALALKFLSPDYRFKTALGYSGLISDGTLEGDLYIVGGGDPTFGSANPIARSSEEVFAQWARSMRELGIERVAGTIVADARVFSGPNAHPTWQVEDLDWYYGSGASGLNWNENAFWEKKKGDSTANLYPEYTAAAEFYNYLMDNGIQCLEGVAECGREECVGVSQEDINVICVEQSAPLSDIIKVTNYESNNLYAEALLKTLGREFQGEGSFDGGVKAVKNLVEKSDVQVRGMKIVDGSGLSRVNHISVATLCEVLLAMKNEQDYIESLPYPGSESTLKTMMKTVPEASRTRIRMKSGSMGGVRCLSGYVIGESGTIVFSVFVNNYNCSSSALQKKLEEIILLLL